MKGNGVNEIEIDKDRYTHPPKYQISNIRIRIRIRIRNNDVCFGGGNGIQSWEEEEERRRRSWKFLKQPMTD